MPGTSEAVTQAARLSEIGFPEFTTKLITDVFDALVSANIRQTEAFVELINQVAKSLQAYINDTKDDIDGEQILQFLAMVLPPDDPESGEATKVREGGSLSGDDATALNTALSLPDSAGVTDNNEVAETGALDESGIDAILEAVARRLAANKYDLLQEMVRQGMLRLVVEDGVIETRLIFNTYGSSFYQEKSSDYQRSSFSFRSKARTGAFVSLWAKASASTSYNRLRVSTTNKTDQDRSGSRVQIYGLVRINFRTDYLPLNQ